MAHHVMSNGQGEADRFHAMLEIIQFSTDDALTLVAFFKLKARVQKSILDYLQTRPSHLKIALHGQNFYLVHAWPARVSMTKFGTARRSMPRIPNHGIR